MTGGMRAFLRRGKFVPGHSELEDFLSGRITRQQGMLHLREAVRPSVRGARKLRAETLECLRAWDLVYLDRLAAGRLIPGEQTAAAEPLHGLNANEALLVREAAYWQARARRLIANLPPIVRKSLQARVKKMAATWERDAKEYDRAFPAIAGPKSKVQSPRSKVQARRSRRRQTRKKAKAKAGKRKR